MNNIGIGELYVAWFVASIALFQSVFVAQAARRRPVPAILLSTVLDSPRVDLEYLDTFRHRLITDSGRMGGLSATQ